MQFRLVLFFLVSALSHPAFAEADQHPDDRIIVTGNRTEEAEIAADLAKAITLRSPAGKPLARHYDPVCIRIFGMEAQYADVLADRMRDNMRALGLVQLGTGCSPNIWVGFVNDSHMAIEKLRKDDPQMFGDLHDYEIDRVLACSKAAQAWFAREDRSIDGKPMKYRTIEINGVEREVKQNDPWRASRITGTIRVDMIGSIVVFDRKLAAGRTIRQLADYASFRALAPVKELGDEPGQPQSILSLFTDSSVAPAGLTEFDWTYLAAYYRLNEGAEVQNIHDAAKRAFLDGTGLKKAEKVGLKVEE
jgi:hypothetical protein